MHEMSVCMSLLDEVESVVRQHGGGTVVRVELRIGPLAGVEIPLLEEAFKFARENTCAAKATLQIEPIQVRVRCMCCGAESAANPNRLVCSACGEWRTALIQGDEMLLMRVELECDRASESN